MKTRNRLHAIGIQARRGLYQSARNAVTQAEEVGKALPGLAAIAGLFLFGFAFVNDIPQTPKPYDCTPDRNNCMKCHYDPASELPGQTWREGALEIREEQVPESEYQAENTPLPEPVARRLGITPTSAPNREYQD